MFFKLFQLWMKICKNLTSHNHQDAKAIFLLHTWFDGAHVYMSLLNTMEVTCHGLFYTLCFSTHQATLYFACIFLFICRCELWPACFFPPITLVCIMFQHHCCFLQMVHNIIIINVYLLCPMIAAPFLPNISIRWSWSESQIGVWKKEENSHAFI